MNTKKLLEVLQTTYWQWHLEDKTGNTYNALADGIGKGYKVTWNYFNPNEDEDAPITIPPINVIADTCNFTGNYDLIQFISGECSGFFTKYPDINPDQTREILINLSRCLKEHAEFVEEISKSMKNGIIEPHEVPKIKKEGVESISAIMATIKLAEMLQKKGKGQKQ